jgi:hypothetical protein
VSKRRERRKSLEDQQRRTRVNAKNYGRTLEADLKAAAVRGKYGPKRRPSPVVVKSLETGEVLKVVEQGKFRVRKSGYSPALDDLARAAGFDGYAAYIDSPYWKAIRQRVLGRDRHQCRLCKGRDGLSVHHDRYDFIGCERLEFLKTMCARCHGRIHR